MVDTQIIKGKKLFDHPVSMDICKTCARICQDRIKDKMRTHYFTKENKKERRQKLWESAVMHLEKKLLENGYESLEKFSEDWRHADKWLGRNGLRNWNRCAWKKKKRGWSSQYNSVCSIWKPHKIQVRLLGVAVVFSHNHSYCFGINRDILEKTVSLV